MLATSCSSASCRDPRGIALLRTRRFSVFSRRGESHEAREGIEFNTTPKGIPPLQQVPRAGLASALETEVPRMRLRELTLTNRSRFLGLMERHGFVVLTDVGPIQARYLRLEELLQSFFMRCSADDKASAKGRIYFNERGIPMWHTGYELCGQVREAFRCPAAQAPCTQAPTSSSPTVWPCRLLQDAWVSLLRLLRLVCHQALTLAIDRQRVRDPSANAFLRRGGLGLVGAGGHCVQGSENRGPLCSVCGSDHPGEDAVVTGQGSDDPVVFGSGVNGDSPGVVGGGGVGVREEGWQGEGEGEGDFSVSYALHYPNKHCDPALVEKGLTVGEHVDPSLFVAEPCCGVAGLEIKDRASGRWLEVEALCAGLLAGHGGGIGMSGSEGREGRSPAKGRELILFGGKALEQATGGRVRGAPHRVRRGDERRFCFIYEQKYAEFFPPPTMD
ncbi:unnamed protein product [Discosporangium mesarthrocarpum]